MLDVSISTYGNKGNKQFHKNHKSIKSNFHDPQKVSFLSNAYIWKVNNWVVRNEYLKANGFNYKLAEDYYIW